MTPGGTADPQPSGLAARRAAAALLHAVLDRGRPLDEVLDDPANPAGLPPPGRDRAFARLLAATTLRRLGQLDAVVDAFVTRPIPASAVGVRHILRLGLVQLLFLGTPAHAAVATAVSLADRPAFSRYKGLVNAVLRRAGREAAALLDGQDAARLNTPDWLWTAWAAAYGEPEAHAIAEVHLNEPPIDLTVRDDPEVWAERLRTQDLEAAILPMGSLRCAAGGGAVSHWPGYQDGAWWVQDAAAALPARLLGNVAGQRVADLCAAPGGKTAQLAASGARVTAVDRSPARLKRLEGNLMRLGLAVELVAADAQAWTPEQPFDAVLLDPPCTATGTIRRHPDIARLKRAEDVAPMAALQARLLARAVELVRPGGMLVWCTCSLQPEEGERQIARLLDSGAPVRREPIGAHEVGGLGELVTADGDLRTLPSHGRSFGGLDGFHVARLRRVS